MSPQHRHLNEPVAIKVGGTRSSAISPHNARARSSANEKKEIAVMDSSSSGKIFEWGGRQSVHGEV